MVSAYVGIGFGIVTALVKMPSSVAKKLHQWSGPEPCLIGTVLI